MLRKTMLGAALLALAMAPATGFAASESQTLKSQMVQAKHVTRTEMHHARRMEHRARHKAKVAMDKAAKAEKTSLEARAQANGR